ncbi:ubiquilin-1-like [Sphaeramia orbicularis]|uniref:ubiquilin-1-like n=1 Tax=Sphaeramia orbicularis TaxID=375764 RepID=UPI00117ED519|nr:ubiquilin-1 [Sphaeramia orbicularis]
MSSTVRRDRRASGESQMSERIHVSIKSVTGSRDVMVRGDCTAGQLKQSLAERMGDPAQRLVLIHSGRVLRDPELLGSLRAKDGSVHLSMVQSSGHDVPVTDKASEKARSQLPALLDPNSENLPPPPTSPLFLVEGLDGLGLTNSGPGFFPTLQHQMEKQLLADPGMMRRILGSPLVQSTLSASSPQLTRQLILSNPQTQQLLQTNPEVGDILNNTDIITQVLELIRNPDMIEEVLDSEDTELDNLRPMKNKPESISRDSNCPHTQENSQMGMSQLTSSGNQEPFAKQPTGTLPSQSTDPLRELTASPMVDKNPQGTISAGMQSLLEQITASPGLMESLLSGPYVSSLLNCLSQNPELAAQMLLSHPLFSGNPQLQQQMRQQLPLFLQQMQSPELLSAMFNPKAMEALLQIQQGLQTLAAEAPALIPAAELGNIGANVNAASDTVFNNQSQSGPQVATVTEQQQHFVQQMLQALANHEIDPEETDFQEESEQLSSMGFGNR